MRDCSKKCIFQNGGAQSNKKSLPILIACCIAAIVVIVALVLMILVGLGKAQLTEPSNQAAQNLTIEHNDETYRYNPDVVSFLFIGCDQENGRVAEGYNGQCDSLMLVALNTVSGEVTLIAIPRDSWTEVRCFDPSTREDLGLRNQYLCLSFSYGEDNMQSGQLTCEAVSRLLCNIPINFFYVLNMSGVAPLADALGGVEVTSLEDVAEADISEGDRVVLQGQSALDYVWRRDVRDDYSPGKRLKRQTQFVEAFVNTALNKAKQDPFLLANLLNTASAYSTTNMDISDFTYMILLLASSNASNDNDVKAGIRMISVPGRQMALHDRPTIFSVDTEATKQMVLDTFFIKQE